MIRVACFNGATTCRTHGLLVAESSASGDYFKGGWTMTSEHHQLNSVTLIWATPSLLTCEKSGDVLSTGQLDLAQSQLMSSTGRLRVTIAKIGDRDAFKERGEAHSLPSQVLAILLGGSGVTV